MTWREMWAEWKEMWSEMRALFFRRPPPVPQFNEDHPAWRM